MNNENIVSVRLNNKYNQGFSISHNYKTCHVGFKKRLERYWNLIHENIDENIVLYEDIENLLSYFKQYEIIKKLNVENYHFCNGIKIKFRRDLQQEINLLELSLKHDKLNPNDKLKIKKLIKETKKEKAQYDYQYEIINNTFKQEIKEIRENYKKVIGKNLRKDRQINYQGVITFGNEESNLTRREMNNVNHEELDKSREQLIKEILKDLKIPNQTYYLVKHLDEQQIHYHYEFVGFDNEVLKQIENGEKKYHYKGDEEEEKGANPLIRRRITQKFLIGIQDLAGKCFKSSNFDRGNSKWDLVSEYCEKQGINYKELTKDEKYLVLRRVNAYHKTKKQYNETLNNDLERKRKDLEKQKEWLEQLEIKNKKQTEELEKTTKTLEKTISLNNVLERVEAGTITIKQIQELKEKWKNDTQITRVLNNRQRRLNNKNEFEKYSKNLENLKSNIEKLTEEQKNKEIKIQELKENISEMSEQELKKRINKKEIEQIDEQIKSLKKQGGASEMADLINKKEAKKSDIDYK